MYCELSSWFIHRTHRLLMIPTLSSLTMVSWRLQYFDFRNESSPAGSEWWISSKILITVHYFVRSNRSIYIYIFVTVNNDFESLVMRFANDFHSCFVTSENHWQIASRATKIVIYGNECILSFLTRYCVSWRHNSVKNNRRSLFSPLALRTVFSTSALWRHHSSSVTSREHEVLALWHHIHRLFLHAHIGANALFTGE